MNHPVDLSYATWRKASRSSGTGSDCVEVAHSLGVVAVRDSKDPDGPQIILSRVGWRNLVSRAAARQLDL